MGQGFVADTAALATRVGELRAVAGEVSGACSALEVNGGDLGPGDIGAAVAEVVGQWRDNLGKMTDKINTIAGNVSSAVTNYDLIEQQGAEQMRALAEGKVVESQLDVLRGAAAVLLANRGGKP
ncbi:MAG TPA: DUF6507 family protein [Actinophytocola sp.]|uniref:WXG100 family type VII secretion target n=1 Tax=Actinophytocola sp. TaxID=1872138 RepID=UPI002DB71483|nr:DUF6507 family protein [Actinophytocola sp.]HEU5470106.1 DUF6507 family protein [Actinophytocola sp.]